MKIAYYDIIDGKSIPVTEEEAKKRDEKNKIYIEQMEKIIKTEEICLIIEKSNISSENKEKIKSFIYGKEG